MMTGKRRIDDDIGPKPGIGPNQPVAAKPGIGPTQPIAAIKPEIGPSISKLVGPSIPSGPIKPAIGPTLPSMEQSSVIGPSIGPCKPNIGPTLPTHDIKDTGPSLPIKKVIGPSLPPRTNSDDDDSFGPMPLPSELQSTLKESELLTKKLEIDARAKATPTLSTSGSRDEWMVLPPSKWQEKPQFTISDDFVEKQSIVESFNKAHRAEPLMASHQSKQVQSSQYSVADGLSRDALFGPSVKKSRVELAKDASDLSSRFASRQYQ